jgi:hypothetical protein
MRHSIVLAVILAASAPAAAEPKAFVETDIGLAIPMAEENYSEDVDTSFKFGARIGTPTKFGAIDFGLDFTPFNDKINEPFLTDLDVQRFRFHVGARFLHRIAPKAELFARFGAGIDLIHYKASGNILGFAFEASETDLGIALEASAGILFDLGKVRIGGKLGLPMGFHFEEDDPDDNQDADLEYTSIDLDITFVLAVPF